jgi:hypothetical protein
MSLWGSLMEVLQAADGRVKLWTFQVFGWLLLLLGNYGECDLTLLPYLLTHSTQYTLSWEANRFAASQEIPHILWNPNIHYNIYKCPPLVSFLSQLNLVHTPTSQFLKLLLNIILPSTLGSPKWSLSFRFLPKPYTRLTVSLSALHALPISIFSILSPEQTELFSTAAVKTLHYLNLITSLSFA